MSELNLILTFAIIFYLLKLNWISNVIFALNLIWPNMVEKIFIDEIRGGMTMRLR